jgi:hypothetical protein
LLLTGTTLNWIINNRLVTLAIWTKPFIAFRENFKRNFCTDLIATSADYDLTARHGRLILVCTGCMGRICSCQQAKDYRITCLYCKVLKTMAGLTKLAHILWLVGLLSHNSIKFLHGGDFFNFTADGKPHD